MTNNLNKNAILGLLIGGLLLSTVAIQPSHAIWPFKKKTKDVSTEEVTTESTPISEEGSLTTSDDEALEADLRTTTDDLPTSIRSTGEIPKAYTESEPQVKVMSPVSDEPGMRVEEPTISADAPPSKIYVTVDDPKNPLGITKSAQQLDDITRLIEAKKYGEAKTQLDPVLSWLVDSTEAHITLNKTLTKIPSARIQAELEKQLALQFALLRDKAFFNRGLIALGEKQNGEAVKNLSKVIQSQPRSPLGLKAYEMLQQIGFTEKIQVQEASAQ